MSKRISVIFFILWSAMANAQLPVGRDTITVIESGNVLKCAWAGGLNFCMASHIDLDMDGKQDLVMFDKSNTFAYGIFRCFINKGGTGEVKYIYDAQYNNKFPWVEQWAYFFDYNNDGKADLFTYVLGGIKVYKNTSTPGNLSFQLRKQVIKSNVNPTASPIWGNIFSSPVSVPGFSDIDGDGDLDILTFSSTGVKIEYHKNLCIEKGLNADSLDFELNEYSWGDISENNCMVSLNQPIAGEGSDIEFQKVYHAGSCLMCIDRDNDGDQDLVMGDITCSTVHYCENGGSITNALITDTTKLFPNYPAKASTQVIRMNTFPCTYYLDINNDNKRDLIASPNSPTSENFTSVWYYQNTSPTPTANFSFVKNNFLQDEMIEVGEGAYPCVIDIDNDGLLDLLIGNHGYYTVNTNLTRITYYRNIGTTAQPSYSLITRDYAGISSYVTTYTLSGLVPAAGDIDSDGDYDLLLADLYGKINWLENTAGPGNPCNFSVFHNNFFSTGQSSPYPQVIDVNRDGLLDLLVGIRNGKLAYYKNIGTSTAPSYSMITNALGNVNVKGDPQLYTTDGSTAPFMYDEGGNYKLLCGSINGRIFLYDNIDGNLTGNFNRIDTNVNKINDGPHSTLQYVDINGDGKRDLIVGNHGGGLTFYSSKAPIGINELAQEQNLISIFPNPANDVIEIRAENNYAGKLMVEITDILGKTLASHSSSSGYMKINCSNMSKGVYFFRINSVVDKQSFYSVKKVIIQ